jgi:hypothetical protein
MTILFSLFLSIGHDFILYEESKDNCVTTVQQIDNTVKDECCNHVADLHNNFHFVGILSTFYTPFLEELQAPLSYKKLSSIELSIRSFKPPRA